MFGVWDYVVFSLMLVASVAIGVYYAVTGKNQTISEYLVAGGTMTYLPVALSMIATFQSSIMMLGTPAESYVYGMEWMLGEFTCEAGTLIAIILMTAFLKRLNLKTPFEYYERRFGSRILRLLGNIMSCIGNLFYMSLVLYGQSVALKAVTGLSQYASIIVSAAASVLYTTVGGLRAVIWTDVLQFCIMFIGMVAVCIKGTIEGGGGAEVWKRVVESGRFNFSTDLDPTVRHTVWNLTFGRIFSGFGFLIQPAALQRINATRSLTQAKRALTLVVPGFTLIIYTALAEGSIAYSYYAYKRCDPLASKQIETPNQIVPHFIIDLFRHLPGMSGLFLAALSAASLSTISSCLSAVSHILWYDIIIPYRSQMSEYKRLLVAKGTVLIFGFIGCFTAVIVSTAGSKTLNQMIVTMDAVTQGPLTGLFYLGALCSFVNTKGAITGFVTSVAIMVWLLLGSMFSSKDQDTPYLPLGATDHCPVFNYTSSDFNFTKASVEHPYSATVPANIYNTSSINQSNRTFLETMHSLSYTMFSTLAFILVFLVGVPASLITGGWRDRADPELIIHREDICFGVPKKQNVCVTNIDDSACSTEDGMPLTNCMKTHNKFNTDLEETQSLK